jgi:hypothetical protein
MSSRPTVPTRQLLAIVTMLLCLGAVVMMKSRCSVAVESMFKAIESGTSVDAGAPKKQ